MPPPTKRRKTEPTVVEEITFDLSARHEYLTGFHKRKLQRAKHAQEAAEKRARAERIEQRKQIREERKADLERHVREVNSLLNPASELENEEEGDELNFDHEWTGISDTQPPPIDHEAEYIDEDKYTTVTVEAMDITREGLFKAEQDKDQRDEAEIDEDIDGQSGQQPSVGKRKWTKERPRDSVKKAKKKKRNFRYESKAERKVTRTKQKAKNHKQARERRAG